MSTLFLLLQLLLVASLCSVTNASLYGDHYWQPAVPGRLPMSADHWHGSITDPAAQGEVADSTSWGSTPSAQKQSAELDSSAQALESVVLREAGETALKVGEFVSGTVSGYGTYHYFSYKPAALNVPFDIFLGVGSCADSTSCQMLLFMNGSPFPSIANYTTLWFSTSVRIDSAHTLSCEYRNVPLADCEYHWSIMPYSTEQHYITTVMTPPQGIAEIQSGVTRAGTLDGGASAFYYVSNAALEDIMIFALTVTAGDCDLYVSATIERPGPNNYTWSSVDDGDDLVIVNGTHAGPGGYPGLYYYVGVWNKRSSSSSSYSVVGSGYSTTGSPLNNAWYLEADNSQNDYAMANTYRYYYLYIQGVWPVMTITLDSLRGDADIYVNVNSYASSWSADNNGFPTTSSAQYNSTTIGRDQLNITAPTSGYYVWIAVYSKGADSRYSIAVTGEGRIATLYTYGYPVTAQVSAGRSLYYVATVPNYIAMSNYVMAFTLRSLSGNADLYISDTYMYPNATHHNWTSEAAGDGLDMAVLRGDVASGGSTQLHAGNYYVAVRGSTTSSFQLWAYLRIRQSLQINSMVSYYHYGGVLYWEIEVPRGAEFTVTTTPLAFYGGSFNLYVGNVAEPNPSIATTYQLMTNGAVRVTPASSPCVGTGPTCRYYVAVVRVHANNETEYASFTMFVYSPDVPPTQLLPDVPLEQPSAIVGGSAYQFNVTCPRSKVVVTLVTYATQIRARVAPMSVNRGPLPPFSMLNNVEFGYTETVTAGVRTYVLTFDWNHPLLRGKSMVGRYMLTVMPAYASGWTLLLRADGGSCTALPPQTTMQQLMPYAATVNTTSPTYFLYQTAPAASGYLYFTLTPRNSSASLSGVSILARVDGDVPAAGYSQFSSTTGVLQVAADACSNGASSNVSSSICQYTLAVSSTAGATAGFYLTASISQPLYALDASVPASKLSGSVARSAAASGTAMVSRGTTAVSLVTETCTGSVSVHLNYRTAAIPTSSTNADVSAMVVTAPTALAATISTVNATLLVASIVGLGASTSGNSFETRLLTNLTWSAASPTAATSVVTVTDYRSVSDGYARVRVPLATTPAAVTAGSIRQPPGTTSSLRYSVYLNDTASEYNLRSRCGLSGGAMLVHTAVGLTTSSNILDIKLPAVSVSSRRYTLTVLVEHVWRTAINSRNSTYEASSPAYFIYMPVDVRSGTKQPDDESSSSSGGMPLPPVEEQSSAMSTTSIVVIVVVAMLVVLVAVLVGVWYFKRFVGSDSGGQLLSGIGEDSKHSSLPSDVYVQQLHSQHQQQPTTGQLTGAYYGIPAEKH